MANKVDANAGISSQGTKCSCLMLLVNHDVPVKFGRKLFIANDTFGTSDRMNMASCDTLNDTIIERINISK